MKKSQRTSHERTAAKQLEELCGDAYDELHSHNPKAALAFAGLGKIVPKLAHATPGWSTGHLTRSFFHRGKVH